MKRIVILACAILMTLCMFGCSKEKELVEYSNGEIVLMLPEGMDEEYDNGDFEYTISKNDMIVYVSSITREELASYGYENITLKEFTEELIDGDEVLLRKTFSDHDVFSYISKVDDKGVYTLGGEIFQSLVEFVPIQAELFGSCVEILGGVQINSGFRVTACPHISV